MLNRLQLYHSHSVYDVERRICTAYPIKLSTLGVCKTDQWREKQNFLLSSIWELPMLWRFTPKCQSKSCYFIAFNPHWQRKTRKPARAQGCINAADCLAVNAKWVGCELLDSLVHYSEAPVAVSSSLAKHCHTQLYPVIPHYHSIWSICFLYREFGFGEIFKSVIEQHFGLLFAKL